MISLATHRVRCASILLAAIAIGGGLGGRLVAGEPIVFGTTKPKVEPDKEKTPIQTPFKFDKSASSTPLDFMGVIPPMLPRMESNPRKDKRHQNADDEKRNWMFLDQGDLQNQDDERDYLGLRGDDGDNWDKNSGSRDFTFKDNPASKAPGQSRMPGSRRKTDATLPPSARSIREDDPDSKREPRSSAIVFGNADRQLGANSGTESDLPGLLGSKTSDRNADGSTFSLHGLFSGADAQGSRDRQSRTETFKQLLSGPSSVGGLSDPVNSSPDYTRQPLNPVMPSTFGNSTPQTYGNSYFPSPQSSPQPGNSLNYLGSPDLNSRPSGFAPPPQSAGGWKPTEVQWPKPRF